MAEPIVKVTLSPTTLANIYLGPLCLDKITVKRIQKAASSEGLDLKERITKALLAALEDQPQKRDRPKLKERFK